MAFAILTRKVLYKLLIFLCIYICTDCNKTCLSRRNGDDETDCEVRLDRRFNSLAQRMEKSRNLAGQLRNFYRHFRSMLERDRNRMRTIRMLFRYLVGVHQFGIDGRIRLNEPMELPTEIK